MPGASWVLPNASDVRQALCGRNTMPPIAQPFSAVVHFLAAMILNKENQTGDIHFLIFHLAQYIQNSIISTCNQYKTIINELLPTLASSSNPVCILDSGYISVQTLNFYREFLFYI